MPSGDEAQPRPRSLARRLAWTLALSAAVASTVALATAMFLADALVVEHVERSTRNATAVLAAELDEKPELISEFDEEVRELGIDVPVAVARDGQRVAGDPSVALGQDEPCAMQPTGEFICQRAMATDPAVVVYAAAPADRVHGHRTPLAIAAIAVLAVVAAIAGLLGVVLARRVLAPVDRLRETVADVDASAPGSVRLPPESGLEELDALRSALANLLHRLDAELERTRTFAANAAHELRTPLTKLGVELELAAESNEPSPAETFARLQKTTARLTALTERLLLLATPHEALETSTQATSMAGLAEEVTERRSPEDRPRLHIDVGDDDGLVRGDPVLLAAVVDNAVDNALKFSDGPVTVTVHEDPDNARVIVDIDDEGPGVSDASASALFDPFARAPEARRRPGHGLGLALCAHITQAYGGTVHFVPDRPAGARLRIDLPLAR
jgi:signal transduction histidine kinase